MVDVGSKLTEVFEQSVRVLRHVSTSGDLSLPAALLLVRLVSDGPHRVTDLARLEGVSQPGMTQLVSRMERDGLVRRATDETDARVVRIEPTRRGHALLRRRHAQRTAAMRALLGQLNAADQAAIREALPALERLVDLAAVPTHGP